MNPFYKYPECEPLEKGKYLCIISLDGEIFYEFEYWVLYEWLLTDSVLAFAAIDTASDMYKTAQI